MTPHLIRKCMPAAARAGTLCFALCSAAFAEAGERSPLVIEDQGSLIAGGGVRTQPGTFDPYNPMNPSGQTYHGDHVYAFYQKPVDARPLPIVMWHGAGQSAKSWETTADGREGFQNIFLRRGFSTYLIDQPRRGDAGRSLVETTIKPVADEQLWFNQFRIGLWPETFAGSQFPPGPEAQEQFFRSMTPNTGPYDIEVVSDGVAALLEKTGPAILFTHSQGGGPGWLTAIKSRNVRAIVAFEPGSSFVFPEGEAPAPIASAFDTVSAQVVTQAQFEALTRIPILILYGDNIPAQPVRLPAQDSWRARLEMARLWRDAVNRHGGDARLIHLPEIGIKGNSHFPFSDLNNLEIADLVSKFLAEKALD
ncbi:alpha/beta fold hydrolase [Pseudomonas chlororaphis subsp. aurantiaca]|uniref:alpha/beta hydrolase n=1 Tax=Pseudomonas chlororaphis TaxID=587753 RepID=UPI0027DD2242|nr:alpha/beta fold hydrolase [Pseudomonas chlororaphis]WMJ02430.1 alpha/beta fold hydrolase [Pseudomonas chlororaphis subsp. aurantiaca]